MKDNEEVLIKDAIPLQTKSLDSIINTVKYVMGQPNVVRFVVDARKDTLDFWRVASPEEAAEKAVSFRDVLRTVSMEEYIPTSEDDQTEIGSFQQLFEMFEMVADAGCSPSHILSGCPVLELRKWISISRKSTTLYGVPLMLESSLEEDVLIICGAKEANATAADIKYAVKVTMP